MARKKEKQSPKRNNAGDEYRLILQTVREYIFENHRFPSVSQLSELTKIPNARCKKRCEQLIRQNQLYSVFGGGKGLPIVVIPFDMMQGVLRTQAKPQWMTKPAYSFANKKQLDARIDQLRDEVNRYEMFERLLYTGDIPLEEAVAYALEWLGFKNVEHRRDDQNNPDITFEHGGKRVLVEVEGTTKAGDKRKILQLDGWVIKEISDGVSSDRLEGLFVVNHYREDEPDERSDPLTPKAKEFLKYHRSKFLTTLKLFNIIKDVMDKRLSKEDAREMIHVGEKFD